MTDIAHLLPGISPSARTSLRRSCRFAHRAVLLFPTRLDDAIAEFSDRGLAVVAPIPSVVVRRRLCARYRLTHEACDVSVARVRTPATGVLIELFLFPKTAPALEQHIIDAERTFGFEDHLALEVDRPDERTFERLITILQHDAGLIFEGGGHNPHEGAAGSTVLYFVRQTEELSGGPRFERFELYCHGDFSSVVEQHPVHDDVVGRVYADWAALDPPVAEPVMQGASVRHDGPRDGRGFGGQDQLGESGRS